MRSWGVGIVLLALLAGCFSSGDGPASSSADGTPFEPGERPDGANAYDQLYAFAMGHPNRRAAAFPAEAEAAREYLRGQLQDAGLRVEDQPSSDIGTNVLGRIEGSERPGQWLVLSCHLDTMTGTIYGARDDGLGCAALLEMARAFATWSWNRTLVFAFFDEEESGLIGAKAFVEEVLTRPDVVVAANLNFDPAGLHWPCGDAAGQYPVHLFITESKLGNIPGYQELLDAALAGLTQDAGVPADMVTVDTFHAYAQVGEQQYQRPGSDDDAFDEHDLPAIWFGAPPTDRVGDVQVWAYPNHVPADTAQMVELRCGSADLLRQGLQVAMDGALGAVRRLDVVATRG